MAPRGLAPPPPDLEGGWVSEYLPAGRAACGGPKGDGAGQGDESGPESGSATRCPSNSCSSTAASEGTLAAEGDQEQSELLGCGSVPRRWAWSPRRGQPGPEARAEAWVAAKGGRAASASRAHGGRRETARGSAWGLLRLERGSYGAAVFSLASSAMGVGCLSLPFMLKSSGILQGLLMLVLGAFLAHMSLVVLMAAARRGQCGSLAQLVASASANPGAARRGVDLVVATYGVSAVLCCLIFLGDFFAGVVGALLDWDVPRGASIAVISACVVWPLSLPRSLGALRYASALSVAATCLTALAVACRAPTYAAAAAAPPAELGAGAPGEALLWWSLDPRCALRSFGLALFAFASHTNAVPVAASLRQADEATLRSISFCSVCVELVIYVTLALGGYLSFRGATQEDFILNYPRGDAAMLAVRCLCGAAVCIGVPINLSPAASSIAGLLRGRCGGRAGEGSEALHYAVVTSVVAGCAVLAVQSQHVAEIIGLIGGSLGSIIVLVWPAMVFRRSLFHLYPPGRARSVFYALVCAAFAGFAAFAAQLYSARPA